ncbi:MAG: hypothetical protein ACI9H8_001628 [Lysobacterales bacterium]|jgi:hypothetical protein
MKTQAIQWDTAQLSESAHKPAIRFKSILAPQFVLRVLAALLPAIVVGVLTVWAISSGFVDHASAVYWGLGFIFLALAVENEGRLAKMLGGSGVILMAFAWLSSRIAPEFGVLAGFILMAWVAIPILRRQGLLDLSRYFGDAN